MKFLITGATGFIGKSLVELLIQEGHLILAISRTENVEVKQDKVIWIKSSLELDENSINRIRIFEPEVLIHLAWEKIPDFSFNTSIENLNHQITFFRSIFNIASLGKIIVTGSCWEYNKKKGFCLETENIVSSNYFTWAKNSLRDFLHFECLQNDIKFIWARVFYVYGPQQRKESLLPTVIRNVQCNVVPAIRTPSNANDFIYIDDLTDGLLQFAQQKIPSGIYNLGWGESIPIIDIIATIESIIHQSNKITSILLENMPIRDTDFWSEMSKTRKTLNWGPRTSIEIGVKKMINQMSNPKI
jgi:nucleoside-diphosphate-sugar epimerase